MKKFVCIHGHFYQPPRENPWTGVVDAEPSAAPFHDWNQRIAKECYEANISAPILDEKGQPRKRVNNFSRMSFDIGPTLLNWLKKNAYDIYHAIIEADRQSVRENWGHGNAMAQVYNHMIMPLATKRDQITQVVWGIKDFQYHFGRKPEGMWLSEAAVNRQSLQILAEQGIRFTVLAPHQIRRKRHLGFGCPWEYIKGENADGRQAYRVLLDGGRQFHVFVYDAAVARGIAFEGLLHSGDALAARILATFSGRDRQQIVSAATDGESFGHHHKFGEMALAYALEKIKSQDSAVVTNYAFFLDKVGSFWEAEVQDNSSWSCAHGVERWRSDCGCAINPGSGFNQKWRTALRDAFDIVKQAADHIYEEQMGSLAKDPWALRNDYVELMLEPTLEKKKEVLSRHQSRQMSSEDMDKACNLLEAQKFSMFMYTSCGWFFDDVSGIEPVKNMQYALRAIELLQPYFAKDIMEPFEKVLAGAQSNVPQMGNGRQIFEKFVKPLSTYRAA